MSYPPPYRPHPYQPPRVTFVVPKPVLFLAVPILALLTAGGVFLAVGLTPGPGTNPQIGDCLASAEERLLGGVDIADCDSAEAKYEVVAKRFWSNTAVYQRDICGDRDGTTIRQSDGKYRDGWEICVVPRD